MSNTKQEVQLKSVHELMSEVEDISIKINELPDVIQLLIEGYKLDERDWTENEEYDFIVNRGKVYNVLTLVQRILWEVNDEFSNLNIRKAQTETASTDQSN